MSNERTLMRDIENLSWELFDESGRLGYQKSVVIGLIKKLNVKLEEIEKLN